MIKRTITYTDYNDAVRTEDFYFNLDKRELLEMELDVEGGLENLAIRLTETEDAKEAYGLFKKILLSAYGVKGEDGVRFEKSEELTTRFQQSPAFGELIFEMLQRPEEGGQFIQAMLPKSLAQEVQAAMDRGDVPSLPTESKDEAPVAPKEPKDMTREELLEAFKKRAQG